MKTDPAALAVFLFFFILITVMASRGALARPKTLARWTSGGSAGRRFGTWITWFLVAAISTPPIR